MNTGRRWMASLSEDELLPRLYQQLTERQAAQFAPEYDMAAGLDRYRAWLGEHAAGEHSRPEATQLQDSTAPQARTPAARADWNTAQAMMTALYREHYSSLRFLTDLLVDDYDTATEIVEDAFNDLHASWRSLPDSDHALPYLRRSVVNRSRSVLQHREIMDKIALKHAPDLSAGHKPLTRLERADLTAALQALPPRQREAMALRYHDLFASSVLSDAQIASAMGISIRAVKRHAKRAESTLRAVLKTE
jgi:RNA polymerase sigma factor (sigma-70 family)